MGTLRPRATSVPPFGTKEAAHLVLATESPALFEATLPQSHKTLMRVPWACLVLVLAHLQLGSGACLKPDAAACKNGACDCSGSCCSQRLDGGVGITRVITKDASPPPPEASPPQDAPQIATASVHVEPGGKLILGSGAILNIGGSN